MIPGREIVSSLSGALQLARMDPDGMARFNRTVDGFWRSFFAAVIVAPAYVALTLMHLSQADVPASGARILLVESLTYVIGWVAFPLAMAYIAPMLDRDEHYIPFIVAYNWAAVWQTALFLGVSVLAAGGAVPGAAADLLALLATLAILFYQWFIARTALELGGGRAAAVVALDVALALLITGVGNVMVAGEQG